MVDEEKKNKIVESLKMEIPDVLAIYVFGSVADGSNGRESDLDLAFLANDKIGAYDLFQIASKTADIVGCEVDLVDLSSASTVFAFQIISKGKLIYCADETAKNLFELAEISQYHDLNITRRPIFEEIEKTGKVLS